MHPNLKFQIKQQEDIRIFFSFIAEAEYTNGRDLKWAVVDKYPFFKQYCGNNTLDINKTEVVAFVKSKYQENAKEIKEGLVLAENKWGSTASEYFKLVNEVFGDFTWTKGKYIAYPTIWGMFPRDIKNKTFQIPYKSDSMSPVEIVIAHEMLHFIFYKYIFKVHPELQDDEHEMAVWHTSEIFNVIVQNSKKWVGIFGVGTPEYPEHEKINKKLLKKYPEITYVNINCVINDIVASNNL